MNQKKQVLHLKRMQFFKVWSISSNWFTITALSDDSGLVIPCIGNQPGIFLQDMVKIKIF